ncbi:MAG: hypothetical protein FGM32_11640 [Candidatus Kapabacteria bacterium]|nr:hypothetical protein [Candidatus Kapabacteria bacterium]
MKNLLAICMILSFVALAKLPIGYYTILRLVLTVSAVIVIYNERDKGLTPWNIAMGLVAIVYNPVIPVHFSDRDIWRALNVAAGVVFGLRLMKYPRG